MASWQRVRETFWLAPALLCLLAAVAAQALIALDREVLADGRLGSGVLLYQVGADGSRDLLGAIAGSMLAVASTTFSITIAVLALTSSSYGPRLVRNFMADRGNQLVLGTYVATYLYTLLVLRSIRTIEDDGQTFVPHLAVNGAVLLAVVSLGVLVWFIHHISDSIQVWTLAGRVHGELRAVVTEQYPEQLGDPAAEAPPAAVRAALAAPAGLTVRAARSGYVVRVESDRLMRLAMRGDLVVELTVRPGSFVVERGELARVRGDVADAEHVLGQVRRCLPLAEARSPFQDVEFATQQLVEMAVRALSPGTNDPYTALNALDELSDGLAAMSRRSVPAPARLGEDGAVRVVAPRVELTDLIEMTVNAIRAYGCAHPEVVLRTVEVLGRVGREAGESERQHLGQQAERLLEQFGRADPHPHDLRRVSDLVARTRAQLRPAGHDPALS